MSYAEASALCDGKAVMETTSAHGYDRLAALDRENEMLRARLQACEQAYALAQFKVAASKAQERAKLLSTVAQVANLLLKTPDYRTVLPDVVQLLGEVVGSDRCSIGENITHPASGQSAVSILPEWCQAGVTPSKEYSPHSDQLFLWQHDAPYIDEKLLRGEVINCLVADLPEPDRSLLAAQGNTAELFVPIVVNQTFWGFIAFDNCGEPRLYDEAEVAILQVAADSIAAAIERQAKDEELRRSEALYRSLFEISNEGIWRWALDQPMPVDLSIEAQVEFVNQHLYFAESNDVFAQMYGFANAEAVSGQRLSDCFVADSEKNQTFTRTWADNQYNVRGLETEEMGADGRKRYFLNSVMSFIDHDRVTGGWGTQIDITELRKTQQALLQAEQDRVAELSKANEALKRSLNAIAIDADPRQIIAHILKIVAEQFETPLVEYWIHRQDDRTAHLSLTYHQGAFLNPHDQPGHPGNTNFPCFSRLIDDPRSQQPLYFLVEDIASNPNILQASEQIGVDVGAWFTARGVTKMLNIPLWLNNQTIGALDIWLPCDRPFNRTQIELAYTFGQQITLATYLNQLFEDAKQTVLLEERNRMAREIHDTLAQSFTSIGMQLEAATRFLSRKSEQAQSCLTYAQELAHSGLAEARRSVWALQSEAGDYHQLATTLQHLASQRSTASSTPVEVSIIGTPHPLPADVGMNLLRIAQEALNNAICHAQAQTLLLTLTYTPYQIQLQIQDDGIGFAPQLKRNSGGFGLIGMQQRSDRIGGTLTLTSQLGRGTEVRVIVPI
jgi:PAS domain S-box-containing protein